MTIPTLTFFFRGVSSSGLTHVGEFSFIKVSGGVESTVVESVGEFLDFNMFRRDHPKILLKNHHEVHLMSILLCRGVYCTERKRLSDLKRILILFKSRKL